MEEFLNSYAGICVPFLNTIWHSIVFWRILSATQFFIILLLISFREHIAKTVFKEEDIKHDKEIFRLLDLLLSEHKLREILTQLNIEHSYDINSRQYLDKFCDSLSIESRQYLIPKIKKTSLALKNTLDSLRDFIRENFIAFPNPDPDDDSPGKLYPNPEIDGQGKKDEKEQEKYKTFTTELHKNIEIAKKNYHDYRNLVKQILHV